MTWKELKDAVDEQMKALVISDDEDVFCIDIQLPEKITVKFDKDLGVIVV